MQETYVLRPVTAAFPSCAGWLVSYPSPPIDFCRKTLVSWPAGPLHNGYLQSNDDVASALCHTKYKVYMLCD